jgi:ComF family protein
MFKELLNDFIGLFYPNSCRACNGALSGTENLICTDCLFELPYVPEQHISTQKLLGKINVKSTTALVRFTKDGRVQRLLHRLKYNNEPEIGHFLGQLLGRKLKKQGLEIDLIIAVPMHPEKQKLRGYNQAHELAKGIAEIMEIEIENEVLYKGKNTISQTKKTRQDRNQSIGGVFGFENPTKVVYKNVLLVDDVLTTGATLEACGTLLLQAGVKNLHIVTIASTD